MLVLLSILDQGGREGSVICDESPIIPTLSQKCPEGLDVMRDGPILYDRSVFQGNADPLSADLVSQVFDVILEQLSLFGGDLQPGSSECGQHFAEDPEMASGIGGMYGRIIQVAENFGRGKVAKGLGDQAGVGGRRVGQPEGHLDKLVLTKR